MSYEHFLNMVRASSARPALDISTVSRKQFLVSDVLKNRREVLAEVLTQAMASLPEASPSSVEYYEESPDSVDHVSEENPPPAPEDLSYTVVLGLEPEEAEEVLDALICREEDDEVYGTGAGKILDAVIGRLREQIVKARSQIDRVREQAMAKLSPAERKALHLD